MIAQPDMQYILCNKNAKKWGYDILSGHHKLYIIIKGLNAIKTY